MRIEYVHAGKLYKEPITALPLPDPMDSNVKLEFIAETEDDLNGYTIIGTYYFKPGVHKMIVILGEPGSSYCQWQVYVSDDILAKMRARLTPTEESHEG